MSQIQKSILVIGAASSGKSELAEILATKTAKSVIYLATAKVDRSDREWQAKIARHQQRRPATWKTQNAGDDLAKCIEQALPTECLLIDSLGTWVANFLATDCQQWQQMCGCLISSIETTSASAILVGEETGWGVVPAYPLGRLFRDRLGNLSRRVGNVVDTTYLVVGGHVVDLDAVGKPLNKYGI